MDIKCKLCKEVLLEDEDMETHWIGNHNVEWRELQRKLDTDDHVRSHRYLATEGLRGYKWGNGIGVVRYSKRTPEEKRRRRGS